jgi:TetR/AcrR family transcriptional repressor of nem operon
MSALQRTEGKTPTRILDIAEELVQLRGFNGFSYADIASALNVTKASLHYHFAGKAELGEALIGRYARYSSVDAGGGRSASRGRRVARHV